MSCSSCKLLLSNEPETMDLVIVKDVTLGPFTCTMVDEAGDPVPLTGTTIVAEILDPDDLDTVLVTITVDIIPGGDENVYEWQIDPADMAALTCGTNPRKEVGKYPWRMLWTELTPKVVGLYSGTIFYRC